MKKILILAAVAALALTACKKDPAPAPSPDPKPASEFITGTGSINDPYVLYKAEHLDSIAVLAKPQTWETGREYYFAADSTCFKLGNDIDCAGATRKPIDLQMASNGGKKIDFDGGKHTIKSFKISEDQEQVGLFANLVGNIHDLKVKDAEVTVIKKKGGILVGQASTGNNGLYTSIYNCSVQGKVICDGSYTDDTINLGGIAGQLCYGEIYQCEADVEIICGGKPRNIGGITGSFGKNTCPIRDCITRGYYHAAEGSSAYCFGGIVGCSNQSHNKVTNCISLAKINCADFAGGIVGLMNYDKVKEMCDGNAHDCIVTGCIAWNDEIKANGPKILDSGIKEGAIVAWGSEGDIYENCWKSPKLGFTDSADHPQNPDFATKSCFIYNGKAVATGTTASAKAKEIGWDETIWDLNTADGIPALKCFQ